MKDGSKFAGNVGRTEEYEKNDIPLNVVVYEASCNSNTTKPDSNLISAVVKEVMKASSENQGSSSNPGNTARARNFAGKLSASNVGNCNYAFSCESRIIDSGASNHMAGNIKMFSNLKKT